MERERQRATRQMRTTRNREKIRTNSRLKSTISLMTSPNLFIAIKKPDSEEGFSTKLLATVEVGVEDTFVEEVAAAAATLVVGVVGVVVVVVVVVVVGVEVEEDATPLPPGPVAGVDETTLALGEEELVACDGG
jgi:ABC-type dipeptide/oligopeptide/nickel transport system permease subunit